MPQPGCTTPHLRGPLAACPSPWQIKPQTEGKQYLAPGVSAGLIHAVVCACASREGCLLILCSFSSLPSLWPDWDSSNRQTPVSLRMVLALLRRVFQATKGLVCPIPLGSSEHCPINLSFSIRVGRHHGVGCCVTRAQTHWQQTVALEHGRTGGLPTPRISKIPFISICLLKEAICLQMARHLKI